MRTLVFSFITFLFAFLPSCPPALSNKDISSKKKLSLRKGHYLSATNIRN